MKLNVKNTDFSLLLLLKNEQSTAKGNKRRKLRLFSCEESKLIKLTSFLLYILSADALENNFLYRKEGWGMDNIVYCYILPQFC